MDNMTIYDVCNECLYQMTHHFRDNDIGEFYKYMTILKQIVNENLIISPEAFSPKIIQVAKEGSIEFNKLRAIFETNFAVDKKILPVDYDINDMCKKAFIDQIKNDISAESDKYWKK